MAALLASATALATISLGVAAAPTVASASSLPSCPMSALNKAKKPVTINFWNSMTRANGQTLTRLTNEFNASQHEVHVNMVQQASYTDTWQKYQAGLSNGQLPNVVQLQDINLAGAVQSRSILPVQSCINATHYKTSDFIGRVLAYWRTNKVQQGMPFAVSGPILYYNKAAFTKAGLDPNKPPATLTQLVADAKKIKAAGYQAGMGLKLDPWHLETWLATANRLFVNHSNGRSGTATAGVFDTAVGRQIFTELDAMVRGGSAATNPTVGPSQYDNLLGIGSGKYAMTIDTSAVLGTLTQILQSGQYKNIQLGVAPFPVLSTKYHGGIEPGGSGLYITKKGASAAQQAASWKFISFLDSANSQATWAAGTGYIPIRQSATKTSTVQQLWANSPGYKVAYQQLVSGSNTAATQGAVIGAFPDVRTAVNNAELSMYQEGLSPKKALANAQRNVNNIISQYNQRLGS